MRLAKGIALALVLACPAYAQDAVDTSNATAPTQVRLPLLRALPDGDRVVIQMAGSANVPVGTADGFYVGPNGFTPDIAQAQDFRGKAGVSGNATQVTGPMGSMGAPGMSAYQIWLSSGNEGDRSAFLASLIGPQGAASTVPGPVGAASTVAGPAGPAGKDSTVPGPMGPASTIPGPDGRSAYQVAQANGFAGTQAQWLASLVGPKGDSITGLAGKDGASIVGPAGPKGDSVTGPAGRDGIDGQSIVGPKGDRGETGATGAAGSKGDPGQSITGPAGTAATITIGTTTALSSAATPTVTNTGTTSAAILNFGIPRAQVYLTDITLTQTATIAIALGPRTLTVATNCIVGDRLVMHPAAAMPAGYMLGDVFCSANGTAQATLFAPALAIGANYSITAKVTAFR